MKRILYLIIIITLGVSCSYQDVWEELPQETRLRFSQRNTPNGSDVKLYLFNEDSLLYGFQTFPTYPDSVRTPVGKMRPFFVTGSANFSKGEYGVTTPNDVMYQLPYNESMSNYHEPEEIWSSLDIGAISFGGQNVNIDMKRAVGQVNIDFQGFLDSIDCVIVRIVEPTSAISFKGEALGIESGRELRVDMIKDPGLFNHFTASFLLLPQDEVTVRYRVLYKNGQSQEYEVSKKIKIDRGVAVNIESSFNPRIQSEITYSDWESEKHSEYFAGFQVRVDLEGGNPVNYSYAKATIRKTSVIPNEISEIDSIPLVYRNNRLYFASSQLISSGDYRLNELFLYDKDTIIYDPNTRATGLDLVFQVPGQPVDVTLDGRQNEEEYYVRQILQRMHGSATNGSIYPGSGTFASRCLPEEIPSINGLGTDGKEGTEVRRWEQTAPGGHDYAIVLRVINNEWRIVGLDFQNQLYPFATSVPYDARWSASNGRVAIDECIPLLYLEMVAYSKLDLDFGNTLANYSQVKRLNTIVFNCYGIPNGKKYDGDLPVILSEKDMVRFEVNASNLNSTIPEQYSNWINIDIINLWGNPNLTGTMPATFGNFPRITQMRMFQCNMSGDLPLTFSNYVNKNLAITLHSNNFSCMPQDFLDRYTINVIRQQYGNAPACP